MLSNKIIKMEDISLYRYSKSTVNEESGQCIDVRRSFYLREGVSLLSAHVCKFALGNSSSLFLRKAQGAGEYDCLRGPSLLSSTVRTFAEHERRLKFLENFECGIAKFSISAPVLCTGGGSHPT